MFKIAICDDDKRYRQLLKDVLEKYNIEKVLFEFENGESLLESLWQCFDLIFLEIQMDGINGNETARILREVEQSAVLVFCTNYQSPTPDTIKVRPFRYIMKDLYNKNLLGEMPAIINETKMQSRGKYLNLHSDGEVTRIQVKNILYISVTRKGAIVHILTGNGEKKFYTKEPLKLIFEKVKDEGFSYAHNSYIVNMANIQHIEKSVIWMEGGEVLTISRSKKKLFDDSFSAFLEMGFRRNERN